MKRVHAVEHDAGRTGAGERGGDFLADVAGLADADDDDLAASPQNFHRQFDRLVKGAVEPGTNLPDGGHLNVEHPAGLGQMTHS